MQANQLVLVIEMVDEKKTEFVIHNEWHPDFGERFSDDCFVKVRRFSDNILNTVIQELGNMSLNSQQQYLHHVIHDLEVVDDVLNAESDDEALKIIKEDADENEWTMHDENGNLIDDDGNRIGES